MQKEKVFWMQRAKVNWLRDGDKNTKFFHAQASKRRKKNFIKGLKNNDGFWCGDQETIESIAKSYFQQLFDSQGPSDAEVLLKAVDRKVSG
ncbi:hypothetical protein PTKIN_Ptkin03bG0095800 [Pterospermum kingtungense]